MTEERAGLFVTKGSLVALVVAYLLAIVTFVLQLAGTILNEQETRT